MCASSFLCTLLLLNCIKVRQVKYPLLLECSPLALPLRPHGERGVTSSLDRSSVPTRARTLITQGFITVIFQTAYLQQIRRHTRRSNISVGSLSTYGAKRLCDQRKTIFVFVHIYSDQSLITNLITVIIKFITNV